MLCRSPYGCQMEGHVSLSHPLPQASCQAVGGGQRVCRCPPGYGGDGFSCYGDIFRVSGCLCLGRGSPMHLSGEGAVPRALEGGDLQFVPRPMT